MNLAAEMAKLPEPPNDSKPPFWDFWRHDLWARAQEDGPENFVKWPCVYHTMLVEHWFPDVMRTEIDYVWQRTTPEILFGESDLLTLKEGMLGWSVDDLDGYAKEVFEGIDKAFLILPNLRNLVHQAYHLLRWQEATGQRIADLQSIYEFGGGYGAMCLTAHRLGFTGTYYIYDLPEFALLQQWYLERHGAYANHITGNFEYQPDLFIACYSLSETDYAERTRILGKIRANSYLLLYSNKFAEYDNTGYFQSIEYADMPNKRWRHEHIEHLPPESWYTWGW